MRITEPFRSEYIGAGGWRLDMSGGRGSAVVGVGLCVTTTFYNNLMAILTGFGVESIDMS